MLKIKKDIFFQMKNAFKASKNEQAFLLGCTTNLDKLDHCESLPALQSSVHYYVPNNSIADSTVNHWASKGICFCGFIHSHLVQKRDLSTDDIIFARKLYYTYNLPTFWFGIGVVQEDDVEFIFYSIIKSDSFNVDITPITYSIID